MGTKLQIFKETTLPGTLVAHAVYLIAPSAKPDYVEMYVTSATGTARRIINSDDIQTLINNAVAAISEITIVADITARDALSPTYSMYVYVEDATDDATVASGGATYIYNTTTPAWVKVSEAESMDISLNWSAIIGKPTSTAAQIDSAVSNSHTHTNKTQLDLIGEDANGNLTYNGAMPFAPLSSTGW